MHRERFLQLHAWGFNVPRFVQNPCRGHGVTGSTYLKRELAGITRVGLLAQRGELHHCVPSLDKKIALQLCSSWEDSGYNVLMYEDSIEEFSGEIHFCSCGYSSYTDSLGRYFRFAWPYCDFISDVQCRFIVREFLPILAKAGVPQIFVCFGWMKEFSGVKYSKLVTYNFLNEKIFLDIQHLFAYYIST